MAEWMPSMLAPSGVEFPPGPSPDVDPLGAWEHLDATIQAALDDPDQAALELDMLMGRFTFEDAVDRFCTGDVFLHTWDLARAAGLDETLDPDEVHDTLVGLEPIDALLRESGHYGPRVPVADDADEQTRLIAFIGRQP
jgi:uncharacterized protein (TIGR03086 family)